MIRRAGSTLLELVVALALTSIVALAAHGALSALLEARSRYLTAREGLDHDFNAHTWLQTLVSSVDVGTERIAEFDGSADAVTFGAFAPTESGWMERRRVAIRSRGGKVILDFGSGPVTLMSGITAVRFDYLVSLGLKGTFVTEWHTPMSAPAALRLRVDYEDEARASDTLLLLIGGRG